MTERDIWHPSKVQLQGNIGKTATMNLYKYEHKKPDSIQLLIYLGLISGIWSISLMKRGICVTLLISLHWIFSLHSRFLSLLQVHTINVGLPWTFISAIASYQNTFKAIISCIEISLSSPFLCEYSPYIKNAVSVDWDQLALPSPWTPLSPILRKDKD